MRVRETMLPRRPGDGSLLAGRPEYGVGVAQRCVEQVAAWGSFHRSVEYEIVFHFVASHKAAPEPLGAHPS